MSIPAQINWPNNLTSQTFLDEYWQQKPLLCPQAFPTFDSPISPDDLAFFACEPGGTPRLILQNNAGYTVEHGPFPEDRFETLTENNWSLLVSDVEKHWPELQPYLIPFQFLPSWRIDDLMVSYAPAGASVGAHVDAYDVFLLQATGTREWQIDEDPNATYATKSAGDLAHIDGFKPTHTFLLEPGDMLYLPPGVAHHGIAVGDDCTTWSIGFRAPSQSEIVEELSTAIMDKLGDTRFTDPGRKVATGGEIDTQSLTQLRALWDKAVSLTDDEFNSFAGSLLTYPHPQIEEAPSPNIDTTRIDDQQEFNRNPFCRLAFIKDEHESTATLYADAVGYKCSLEFARRLCEPNAVLVISTLNTENKELAEIDRNLFSTLVATNALIEQESE